MRTKAITRTPKFKPFRDRPVPVMTVDCPSCGAPKGQPCTRMDGSVPSSPLRHPRRRAAAHPRN